MANYISLLKFTPQGVKNFQTSPQRAADFVKDARNRGLTVKELVWVMGPFDGVMTFEAESDEVATAAMLSLAALGNVTTQTMRTFDAEQFKAVISNA